jgi:glutaredoxin
LGLSVDSVPCLKAWADSLGGISYPLLSDFYPHGEVALAYGVLRTEGFCERAIFVIDIAGSIRYIDIHDIDEQPDNEELFRVLQAIEPNRAAPRKVEALVTSPLPEAGVVLFCTSWCPDCRRARAYFKERGIEYVEVDITRNREAARQVREWSGGSEITPTIKIGGQVLHEFNAQKLDLILSGKTVGS